MKNVERRSVATPEPHGGVDLILIAIGQLRQNLERIAADGMTDQQRTHIQLATQKVDALEHFFVRVRNRPTRES